MSPAVKKAFGLVTVFIATAAAFGCQSIVGIEERSLETCDDQCRACEDYCDTVEKNCDGDNAVYQTRDACLGICAELPLGDFVEPGNENTIACRLYQAELAEETGEPAEHCKHAGPGGGNVCGTDCEAYCQLFPRICADQGVAAEDCVERCEALPDVGEFSIDLAYDAANIECRLIHLSNATVANTHCGHAEFLSTLHCMRVPDTLPDCTLMCTVATGACTGELAVYDDFNQCMAVCAELEPGTIDDLSENTVGCRVYHAHSSLIGPKNHCPHAGPGGAGHCGELDDGVGNCESYCRLLERACGGEFAATFGDQETCQAECRQFPGADDDPMTSVNETEQYSITLAESQSADSAYACRLLHTARALAANGDPVECQSAIGAAGSVCPPL